MPAELEAVVAEAIQRYDPQGDGEDQFFWEVLDEVKRGGRRSIDAALRWLSCSDARMRSGAAQVIGRVGEFSEDPEVRAQAERILLEALARDDEAREGLSVGLGLIWISSGSGREIALASDRLANYRFAAAHAISLWVSNDDEDAEERKILERLLSDPDAGVRDWARFGLDSR